MTVEFINLFKKEYCEQYREERARNSSYTVMSVKTRDGWKTIDSPYDPVKEARHILEQGEEPCKNILLLGAGSGFIASELSSHISADILIVTGSKILAQKNKEVLSTTAMQGKKITLIGSATFCDDLITPIKCFFENNKNIKIIVHPREHKAYPWLFNPLSVYLNTLTFPVEKKLKKFPKKILLPALGQIFEPDIQQDLRSKGIDVIPVESFAHRKLKPDEAWNILLTHKPDLIFSTNNKGSDRQGLIPEACAYAGIPWATWFLDQPYFLVTRDEMHERQNRFSFCWDTAGTEACRELGFTHVELLPLAAHHKIFTPGDGDRTLEGKIVYVGSPSFGNEEKYFAAIKNDPFAERIAEVCEQDIWRTRKLPALKDIEEAVQMLGIQQEYFSLETFHRLPAFALYKANLKYRIEALCALADLQPVVYGEGWEGLLPDTVELRSYVDYYTDLAAIYRSDAVHLSLTHLQMRHYPNQRIFDAGACSRIVLGERLEGWESLFGSGFDDLLFSDFFELREKALTLMHSREKRALYGRELFRIIREKHTLSHRLDTMLNTLYNGGAH
ncbi:MAG: glycosyltransferase [Pseudomonadota bacterium]